MIAAGGGPAPEAEKGEGEETASSPPVAPEAPPPTVPADAGPPPPPGAVSGRGAVPDGVPGALVGGLDVVEIAGVVVLGTVAVAVGVVTVVTGVLTVTGGTATVTGGTVTVVTGGTLTVTGGTVTVTGGVVTVTGGVAVVTGNEGRGRGTVTVSGGSAVVIGRVGTCAADSSATAAPDNSPRPARSAVAARYLTPAIYSRTAKTTRVAGRQLRASACSQAGIRGAVPARELRCLVAEDDAG